MKIVVAVIVYKRIENLDIWLNCWKQCDTTNSELRIIHNFDKKEQTIPFKNLCDSHGVKYISRQNVGMDIGALQDVSRDRLRGFATDYDLLLWATDDAIPMDKSFIQKYTAPFSNAGVGVTCMEVSTEVKTHIRTTGFCIRQTLLKRLQFPADPIMTKNHCWQFEHLSRNAFYEQVKRRKLEVIQLGPIENSLLWDTGKAKRIERQAERNAVFNMTKESGKVCFICPVYQQYPEIIGSLINQTYKNWELILIHDGPCDFDMKAIVNAANDPRIKYIETENRAGKWGHSYRQWGLKEIERGNICPDAEYVVITNGDNHHVPVYTQYMVNGFTDKSVIATYCQQMVHSYTNWKILNCRLALGHVDCAGVMIRRDAACRIGWRDIDGHSSDWTYFSDIIKEYGQDKFKMVPGCLLIHN